MGAQPWDEQRRVCSSRALPDAFQPTVPAGARQQHAHGLALICRKGCTHSLVHSVPADRSAYLCAHPFRSTQVYEQGNKRFARCKMGRSFVHYFFWIPTEIKDYCQKKKKKEYFTILTFPYS